MNKDLRRRTPAEDIWLWRRGSGRTQTEMAALWNCGRTTFWKYESGLLELPPTYRGHSRPGIRELLPLARRRAGLTTAALAGRLGISRVTLAAWEREVDSRLVAWWLKRGWTFN